LSIELLAAAQAYEYKQEKKNRAHATDRVYRQFRDVVRSYSDDRPLAEDIRSAVRFVHKPAPI
jgi:histidine ammonia-lyase